ncbi:MAG: hypothetical protein ACRD8U_17670 [Pyrinomonadaceae bacterium]
MFETNAICLPSGEKVGDEQDPILAIKATERWRSSSEVAVVWLKQLTGQAKVNNTDTTNTAEGGSNVRSRLEKTLIEEPHSF